MQNGEDSITECEGTLFDTGGESGDYIDNALATITIKPTGATSVTLTVVEFDWATSGDVLFIYDGPDANSPQIGLYNGNNPPPTTITSTGPAITIVESTNGFGSFPGFEIDFSCLFYESFK